MNKRAKTVVLVVAAAFVAAAVSGVVMAASTPERIQLAMSDFAFNPNQLALQAGKVYEITLVNRGTAEHELMIGRGSRMAGDEQGGEMHGYAENFFEGIEVTVEFEGGMVETGELDEVEVEPGGEVKITFTVPAGKQGSWEMACFVPGHYELGMHGSLTVR
ncbi:MAG: plastocyanin/azurin family copper-binding protein [Bacillota bacterium]